MLYIQMVWKKNNIKVFAREYLIIKKKFKKKSPVTYKTNYDSLIRRVFRKLL